MMFQMTFVRWAWDEIVWDVLGVRTRSNGFDGRIWYSRVFSYTVQGSCRLMIQSV
jgi:hypothetical protein